MLDRKIIWLLPFLLNVFGNSPAHAFFSVQNRVGDFLPENRSLSDLKRPAENIRTQVTGGGETITYVTDPHSSLSRVLSRTKDGQTIRYVYGVGLQYEIDSNGNAVYYHFDHVGNTAALTDESETVIEEFRYSPYGTVTYQKNNHETPFQFGGFFGIQTDSNGLVHMRARFYNPLIRRFVNSDPARDAWNWFAYANGNPVSYVDPSGLEPAPSNSSNIGNLQSLGFSANEGSSVLATTGVLTAPFIFEGTTGTAVTASAAPVAAALPVLLIPGDSPQAANGNYGTQNPISGMIDYATFVIGSILSSKSTESKPTDAPPGTRPIDQVLPRGDTHKIKDQIGQGAKDWTGIAPNGDVITSGPDGKTINHGPANTYFWQHG